MTKTRKKIVALLVLLMLSAITGLSVIGVGAATVGLQAGAPETDFDSNGWYTQAAYANTTKVNGTNANIVSTNPDVAHLGHLAPEQIGGYTAIASFANGKITNRNKLSISGGGCRLK